MRARRFYAHVGASRTARSLQVHPGPANITANGFHIVVDVLDVVEQADPILSHSPCGRGGLAGARTVTHGIVS